VLAVFLFAAFWVVLGIGLFSIAVRGGVGSARSPRLRPRSMASAGVFVLIYGVFGIGLPLLFLIGNHARTSGQVGGNKLAAAEKQGRLLFGEHCGLCHTLAAANAIGKVGPDLDMLQPSDTLVLHAITYGCLQNAAGISSQTCLGYGTMPADIVQGKDAQKIAAFVATVAGKE